MRTKHIIQTTLRLAAFAAVLILAVSCGSDMLEQRATGGNMDAKHTVTFSLGNRHVQTRGTRAAASTGGYSRETTIDANKLYAVVFNAADRTWFKTVQVTNYDNGTFSFDMEQGGDYYMYIVANTTDATNLTGLTTADDEDDFFAIVDATPISDDGTTTTGFLMVSGRQHVNINLDDSGPTTTDLDNVMVYRRAARIDIDGSSVTGLTIKKVVMNKRYKASSYLVRADDNSTPAGSSVETTYELNGTATTNLIPVTATTTNATVDADEWQGLIYSYENPTLNDTELTVTCQIGDYERTTVVSFGSTPVKANTLYTVQLQLDNTDSATPQQLTNTIKVVDWENVTLTYNDLTDDVAPNFIVSSGATGSGTNPQVLRVSRNADSDIVLQVTSAGVYGSEVSFLNRTGASFNFSAGGGTITRSNTVSYSNGRIVETFTIHIPTAMAAALTSADYLTFTVGNAYDSSQCQTFQVKTGYALSFTLAAGPYTYNHGTAIQPAVSNIQLTDDNSQTQNVSNSDCTITYSNNINAGTGTVLVTVTSGAYEGSSGSQDFTIQKATPTLALSPTSMTVKTTESKNVTATLSNASQYSGTELNVTGQNATYVTIPATAALSNGSATISVAGVAITSSDLTITVTAPADDNYNAVSQTFTVKVQNDPGVALASATVGMIVASNGKAYTTSNFSSTYGTAVAVVGYKNGSSGYAIALVNSTSQTWNEITNSGANKNTDCTLADGKRGSVPVAPTGTTWKILTKDNYSKLFQSMGSTVTSNSSYYYDSNVNSKITVSVGGSALGTALSGDYWSTSENANFNGWYFYGSNWNDTGKASSRNVRPVLAW